MEFQNLTLVTDSSGIAVLTVNRPSVMNALNRATFKEMDEVFDLIVSDPQIRGLIITGCGRAFVAGADLSEIQSDGIEENREYAGTGQRLLNKLEALPVPTIAAVNGYALGGGCEIALACDIRIAGEKARFGMPEVSLGVIPCFGGTQRLTRLVGKGLAKELIFTGRKINAGEALNYGLVNRVVPQDTLLDEAKSLLSQIIVNSGTAIKYAKAAIDRGQDMALADGLEYERELSAICYGLPDKKEGMAAFMEKRPPVYPAVSV